MLVTILPQSTTLAATPKLPGQPTQHSASELGNQKASTQQYDTFSCPRFAFSVHYPTMLCPQQPSQNGDGCIFSRGRAKMYAYGSWNVDVDASNQAQIVANAYQEYRKPTDSYTRLGKDFFVCSGTDSQGIIYYCKAQFKQDRWVYIRFEYPQSDKKRFDPIVSHVVGSLKLFPVSY